MKVRGLLWVLLMVTTTIGPMWVFLSSWTPSNGIELFVVMVFFMGSSIGGFWMVYRSIRFEIKPLPYILFAFVPMLFLWYYVERVRGRQVEFHSDVEMKRIPDLTRECFEHVLFDEEPLFVGDSGKVLDVSLAGPEELAKRCSHYYRTSVSVEDLRQPLWKLIRELNERRDRSIG